MPVFAMEVMTVSAHEKTDNLFIYTFKSPKIGELQIVANLTNVYQVGDVVGVAVVGTRLPDGEIKERKVYGTPSFGMALGPVQAELDADLSERFEADQPAKQWTVAFSLVVEAHSADEATKLARKRIANGQGELTVSS